MTLVSWDIKRKRYQRTVRYNSNHSATQNVKRKAHIKNMKIDIVQLLMPL